MNSEQTGGTVKMEDRGTKRLGVEIAKLSSNGEKSSETLKHRGNRK